MKNTDIKRVAAAFAAAVMMLSCGVTVTAAADTSSLTEDGSSAGETQTQTQSETKSESSLSGYATAKPRFTKVKTAYSAARVVWKRSPRADGYKVAILKNGRWLTKRIEAPKHGYTFKDLDRHTKYRFRVRAYKTINGRTRFTPYSYVSAVTNRTVKSKASFKIYKSADRKSKVLYKGGSGIVVTQIGASKKGWAKVYIPRTKREGYARINRFAGFVDLKISAIYQEGYEGGASQPYGCEATSLATVLDRQYKIPTTKGNISSSYVRNIDPSEGDPNYAFWGNPYSVTGYGVYAPPIAQAANRYLSNIGRRSKFKIDLHTDFAGTNNASGTAFNPDNLDLDGVEITEGLSLKQIKRELDKGHSLIAWWTLYAVDPSVMFSKTLYKGSSLTAAGSGTYNVNWIRYQHCAVISGYDGTTGQIIISDVHDGGTARYSYSRFLKGYNALDRQTVVIYPY